MADATREGPDLRVAMFMPGLRRDALGWNVHLDFARRVEDRGLQFQVLTTESGGSSSELGSMRVLPVSRILTGLAALSAPVLRNRSLLPAAATLARHLRVAGRSIDLMHVEVAYPHGAAVALARRLSAWSGPIVLTPMGEDTLVVETSSYGFRRYSFPRWLIQWTMREAAVIRCISPMLERHVAEIAPAVPRRMIPLNVSLDTVSAAHETADVHQRRRVNARARVDAHCGTKGRPVVLALGRLHPFKGLDVLVRAMVSVARAELLIVGPSLLVRPDGDVGPRLLALARAVGVGDRVQWIGAVSPEQSLDWLAAADVVAVPSHLESLNKVCVEAAAVGTPFVVTETTGISAWVPSDGRVGLVVPPGDPRALAAALDAVVGGRWQPERTQLSRFVEPFQPERVATQLVELYRDVIGGRA